MSFPVYTCNRRKDIIIIVLNSSIKEIIKSPSNFHNVIEIKIQTYNLDQRKHLFDNSRSHTSRYCLKLFRFIASQIWNELPIINEFRQSSNVMRHSL